MLIIQVCKPATPTAPLAPKGETHRTNLNLLAIGVLRSTLGYANPQLETSNPQLSQPQPQP